MTQNFEEACICDAVEVVSQLLDEDDSVHFVNRKEQTGLIVAVENGSENVAKLLLDKNSNLEAEGEDRCNAMEIAVKKGYSNIVFLILEKTLDIYYCDQDGNSALKLAILNHKLEMVKALLDKGADINAVDKEERTPLMLSVINHETEMAKVLLDKGTDINAVDRDGRTALMYAVINRETEMVKVLFDKGSDYKTRDKEGWTAFQRANEDHDQDLILLYMECVKARQKKEGLIQVNKFHFLLFVTFLVAMTSVAYVPVLTAGRYVYSLPAHIDVHNKFPFFQFHWKDPEPPTPVHQEPVQTPPPNDNEEDKEEKDVWEKIKDKLGEGVKKVDTFFVENDPGPGIGSALAPLRDVIENLF
jgi:ankyrin repeat protein